MKIILSPAKSIQEKVRVSGIESSFSVYLNEAGEIHEKIKKLSAAQLEKLMDISTDLAVLNHDRFQKWSIALHKKNGKPAGYLFTGAAYQGLDFTTLNKKDQEKAQQHLRILSGMYGVLKPLDLILPYRLEMGTSLSISAKQKNLYQFWGDKIRIYLEKDLSEEKHPLLVNLASAEYFKAAQLDKIKYPVVTCSFKDRTKAGDYRMNMTFAKQARGMMTRFIIQHDIKKAGDLRAFDSKGYYFDPTSSNKTEFVFLRDKAL